MKPACEIILVQATHQMGALPIFDQCPESKGWGILGHAEVGDNKMVERLACEFNVARISCGIFLSENTENQAPPTAVPATDTATIIGSHQQKTKTS